MHENLSNPDFTSRFYGLLSVGHISIPNTPLLLAVLLPLFLPFLFHLKKKLQFITNGPQVLVDGVKKHGSKPFDVPGLLGPITVLPQKYLPELKHDTNFSFPEFVADAYPVTGMQDMFTKLSNVIRRNFGTSLNRHSVDLVDELQFASKILLEDKEVTARLAIMQLVARAQSRIFAGQELSRDERWIHLIIKFTEWIATTGVILRCVPRCVARYVAVMIPGYWKARRAANEVKRMKGDDYELQLFLSGSAIYTTSAALTQMVFDLCCFPEVVDVLREEMEEVGTQELHRLTKMDSFMKESQRLNPLKHVVMQRKVIADVTLSDGLRIKKNRYVMVPATPVLRSPELYPDPDRFDALRFYNLRKKEGMENMHQFVSSTEEFFAFSLGPHTCPGRFLAAHVLKLALVHLLMEYDMSFPDGQTQRPPNMEFEESCFPNAKQKVRFTKRKATS